jgi:hypothetical protein
MRSLYSTCTRLPPNPSKKGKSRSEMKKRKQPADQTNMERRNQPIHLGVTRRRSSRTTMMYWLVFPRLRSTSTKQIRHPGGAVDGTATIH